MKETVKYSQEIAEKICERIALGEPVQHIADTEGMPSRKAVYLWLQKHEEFREMMATARQYQADYLADELLTLRKKLDEKPGNANAIRVEADILKWQAMVRAPRKYGELIRQEVRVDAPLSGDAAAQRIAQLENELGLPPSSTSWLAANLGGKQ